MLLRLARCVGKAFARIFKKKIVLEEREGNEPMTKSIQTQCELQMIRGELVKFNFNNFINSDPWKSSLQSAI